MTMFAINHGSVALCTWSVDTGRPTFHVKAPRRDELLVLEESYSPSLVVHQPAEGFEYRITIGDVPLGDIVRNPDDTYGVALDDRIVWRQWQYFESARGHTKVLLEQRSLEAGSGQWDRTVAVDVYVLPSKIGEDRYEGMAEDLQTISRSLLIDLYGKSRQTHDLRMAKEGVAIRTHDHELHAIELLLDKLGPLLRSIGRRPASRVETVSARKNYWGQSRLTPLSVSWLSRRGHSPLKSDRPLSVITSQKVETFDIPEHRIVRAFLEIIIQRARYCLKVAQGHISAIESERPLRHIRLGAGPTIFESVDQPRIRRLQKAVVRAEQSLVLATAMNEMPFLHGVTPQFVAVQEGAFQRNAEYQKLFQLIRQFLLASAVWYEGNERSDVTKLTSRLFEQWCYLRIIEGFRKCGLELKEWTDALRQNLKSQFILDFDRGLVFEGELNPALRLRFRYEPWILSRDAAQLTEESLCRGSSGSVAWCPDVVIECLKQQNGEWRPIYGVVMDCKYTSMVGGQHWSGTEKYLEIRSTFTQRQVLRQLWLIAPAGQGRIQSEDPAVTFTDDGPTCAPDEAVRFQLLVLPGANEGSQPFDDFAAGIVAYVNRHFGSAAAGAGMT